MNTADEPDTTKRIKISSAAIVDNINKTEGWYYADLVAADYFDELEGAIDEFDMIEIQRKWTKRQVELSRFTYR